MSCSASGCCQATTFEREIKKITTGHIDKSLTEKRLRDPFDAKPSCKANPFAETTKSKLLLINVKNKHTYFHRHSHKGGQKNYQLKQKSEKTNLFPFFYQQFD